jgi:hypothetical protein
MYGMNGWNKEIPGGDTISRAAAIAVADSSDYVGLSVDDVKKVTDEVVKGLKQLPSAQPERKTGKWKKISPASIYECSVCGQNIMTQDIDAYRYCHGCGAEMEVSE